MNSGWRPIRDNLDAEFQLTPEILRRQDESPDDLFYQVPRFVYHIDANAVAAVTDLYRKHFPENGAILDLASSWVSHLPEEVAYKRVVGLGMNRAELESNPRLDEVVVQDLNQQPLLPFQDGEFDGAGICVSIDYLTQPVQVIREVGRVLKSGQPLVITFSNRAFWTKTLAIWGQLSDQGRMGLVAWYVQQAGNFHGLETLDCSSGKGDPLLAVVGWTT